MGKQGNDEITVRDIAKLKNSVTYDVLTNWRLRLRRKSVVPIFESSLPFHAPMNKKSKFVFCLFSIVGVCWAAASLQLDIPPRLQWDNNNGYCGECSIQQIALYYGAYISQYRAREIIDPTQHQDVWVPENSGPVFDALRLNYVAWNSGQAAPQYQSYLVWVKSQLQQKHPVIMDLFAQNDSHEADTNNYDHIVPVTGFTSSDTNHYHAGDTLIFNDNYSSTPVIRAFATLDDTRDMNGNGKVFKFCLPRD